MNTKKYVYFVLTVLIFCIGYQSSFAAPITTKVNVQKEIILDEECNKNTESELIKRVSLRNKFQKSPQSQVESFLKKYIDYSEKNDLKKLKELYSDTYVNNDGFDKHTIFEMMESVSMVYTDMKYDTNIEKIEIDGNYAKVKIHEKACAQTNTQPSNRINDKGIVVSDINYIDYLIKEGNKWKIQSTYMLSEEVTMKYGEAKNMDIKITSPETVGAGIPYEVSVCANNPDGSFALGSIVNEPIIYPQKDSIDSFRAVKNEKISRILTSNKNNNNEYVTVSIALTRAEVEPTAININMTGMALAMKRVNVLPYSQKKDKVDDKEK